MFKSLDKQSILKIPCYITESQALVADLRASVWISASAGSGKTKILVDRVMIMLLYGVEAKRILCLTFTKAAAAEMVIRINRRLLLWATAPEHILSEDLCNLQGVPASTSVRIKARRLFTSILDTPVQIETLHAFSQSLLRHFPIEAGVTPYFCVIDEQDANMVTVSIREQLLSVAHTESSLSSSIRSIIAYTHTARFMELTNSFNKEYKRLYRLFQRIDNIETAVEAVLSRLSVEKTPVQTRSISCEDASFDEVGLWISATALLGGSVLDVKRGYNLVSWLSSTLTSRIETLNTYQSVFFTDGGNGITRKKLLTKDLSKIFPLAPVVLSTEAARLSSVRTIEINSSIAEATANYLRLGAIFFESYHLYKERQALLDYDDLIFLTHHLLESQESWVLYALNNSLDHLLIDEAQDMSVEQWDILRILTEEFFSGFDNLTSDQLTRTIFIVGDYKQSIYSFQGVDLRCYQFIHSVLRNRARNTGKVWFDIPLNTSFRSTSAILKAVDAVFTQNQVFHGISFISENICHTSSRVGETGLVEVWPLITESTPLKGKTSENTSNTTSERLAYLIAHRIAVMLTKKEVLESHRRPIQADDIIVLIRRRSCFVDELVRALKSLGIPVVGIDRMILNKQTAVTDLVALGNMLLLPEDNLTLATVLKGPLISLSEEALFILSYSRGARTLWESLKDYAGTQGQFGQIYNYLNSLLDQASDRRPYELYAYILGSLEGRRKLIEKLGPEAEDAINEFLNIVLMYEKNHVPSLRNFLFWITVNPIEIKRDFKKVEAVRIITVHSAKGLQSPVVFLSDTSKRSNQTAQFLWDKDNIMFWVPHKNLRNQLCKSLQDISSIEESYEYFRLLYVAMTRAEDRLYICGWRTSNIYQSETWYDIVKNAIIPIGQEERDQALPFSSVLRLRS